MIFKFEKLKDETKEFIPLYDPVNVDKIFSQLINNDLENINKSIESLKKYNDWREKTYRHLFSDIKHWSPNDKRGKHYKIGRTEHYIKLLENLIRKGK